VAPNKPVLAGIYSLLPGISKLATSGSNSSKSSNGSYVVPELWTVVQPATFVYSVWVNNKHWYSQVQLPNATVPLIDFQGNHTAGRRDLFDPAIFTEVSPTFPSKTIGLASRVGQGVWLS
jgi:hypothetical protein